jgi:hypothetical protein
LGPGIPGIPAEPGNPTIILHINFREKYNDFIYEPSLPGKPGAPTNTIEDQLNEKKKESRIFTL